MLRAYFIWWPKCPAIRILLSHSTFPEKEMVILEQKEIKLIQS